MASQLEMLLEQDAGLYTPGDPISFGSIYADADSAKQATVDWSQIIAGKLNKVVDLELMRRYSPNSQLPKNQDGRTAGSAGVVSASGLMPWLLVGGALLLAYAVLRK